MASEKLVKALHRLRNEETTASLQYMNHHAVFKNRNLKGIADYLEKAAIEEMKHAEVITDRMLDMGLDPKGYRVDPIPHWSLDLRESIQKNIDLEVEAIELYNEAIDVCITEKDHITRQLLEPILNDEEEHRLQFETILEAFDKMGDKKELFGLLTILESK